MERTWHGREVQIHIGSISDLLKKIPEFGRYPFCTDPDFENEYLDVITREPHLESSGYVPVAAVSKEYGFVTHHEVINTVLSALGDFVEDPHSLKAELWLSKYGARMWIKFLLPNYEFDPGDAYPIVLKVNCLNSVDKSIAIRLDLSWYREESDTEMIGRSEKWYHTKSFKTKKIKEVFANQFRRFSKEESLYKKWYETKLDWNSVVKWLNKTVANKWQGSTAVRAYHIAKTGIDVEVNEAYRIPKAAEEIPDILTPKHPQAQARLFVDFPYDNFESIRLGRGPLKLEKFDIVGTYCACVKEAESMSVFSNTLEYGNTGQQIIETKVAENIWQSGKARFIKVEPIGKVPGLFAPVENVYHVSQVLTWIASKQETIQGQLERLGQIHGLMDALLKQEKLPPIIWIGREYKKRR
ncbi:hypothetical protein F4225_13460 [Candidatus Poribacteria bacterium]|nr:hypothetical protein [Candidatus Poribacteria bacterium]